MKNFLLFIILALTCLSVVAYYEEEIPLQSSKQTLKLKGTVNSLFLNLLPKMALSHLN